MPRAGAVTDIAKATAAQVKAIRLAQFPTALATRQNLTAAYVAFALSHPQARISGHRQNADGIGWDFKLQTV